MDASDAATTRGRAGAGALRELVVPGIAAIATIQLLTALWMLVAPRGFHASVGAFGAYNPHYLGDAMAFSAGIGAGLALAVRWPVLRAGALATATAAIGLHAVNHWFDIGADHPGSYAGVLGALSQTSLTLACAVLLYAVVKEGSA